MKVELIKKIEKGTGIAWYHTEIDGSTVDDSYTRNEDEAHKRYAEAVLKAEQYPEDVVEVLASTTL